MENGRISFPNFVGRYRLNPNDRAGADNCAIAYDLNANQHRSGPDKNVLAYDQLAGADLLNLAPWSAAMAPMMAVRPDPYPVLNFDKTTQNNVSRQVNYNSESDLNPFTDQQTSAPNVLVHPLQRNGRAVHTDCFGVWNHQSNLFLNPHRTHLWVLRLKIYSNLLNFWNLWPVCSHGFIGHSKSKAFSPVNWLKYPFSTFLSSLPQ